MNANTLLAVGAQLLQHAKKEGATDAYVSLSSSTRRSVGVRDGALAHTTCAGSLKFALTAIIGKCRGTVVSSSLAPLDLTHAAKRAVSLARVATKNPYQRLSTPDEWACPMPMLPRLIELLDAYDSATPPTLAVLHDRAVALDSLARSYPGIARTEETSFSHSSNAHVLLMSNGFSSVVTYTLQGKAVSVIAEGAGEMKTGSGGHSAFHFADLRSDEECVNRAGSYAVRQLGAKPIATGNMPIIFDKRVSRSLLAPLTSGIDGDAVYHKSTFLLEKLEQRIFREGVMVVEEPYLPRRLGSQIYDNEGVKTMPWMLVQGGMLTTWMTTIESGAKLGRPSTGHASGTSNLVLRPSDIAPDDLVRDISYGLLVTHMMGKGSNIATGAYSVGVEGFLIENGEITRPVNKVTIAGNLLEMFRELIPASDLSDHATGANAPSCLIPRMMVGGV